MFRVVVGIIALVSAVGAAAFGLSSRTPRLAFDDSVPADLAGLATETWEDFLSAHPGRLSCIEPATLSAAWELGTRAEYQPGSSNVVVRVPGTPATLRNQLVHEFAHHLEFTCPDQAQLRGRFLAAQGFSRSTPWFEGDSWESTPSEHYAEATVEVVLGRRAHHGNIRITHEAVDVVEQWARGG